MGHPNDAAGNPNPNAAAAANPNPNPNAAAAADVANQREPYRCLVAGCRVKAPNGFGRRWIQYHANTHKYQTENAKKKEEAKKAAKVKRDKAIGPSLQRRIQQHIMNAAAEKMKGLGKKAARGESNGGKKAQGPNQADGGRRPKGGKK